MKEDRHYGAVMFIFGLVLIAAVTIAIIMKRSVSPTENRAKFIPAGEVDRGGEKSLVFQYHNPDNELFEIEYEKTRQRVSLRVVSDGMDVHRQELGRLKREVLRLTARPGLPVAMGMYHTMMWQGGFPVWAPYTTHFGLDRSFSCMLFSEHATMNSAGLINAAGTEQKWGYYGYDEDPDSDQKCADQKYDEEQ
jgi:hypothetical protein